MPGLFGLNKIIQTQGWDEYFMVAEVHENIHSFIQSVSQLLFTQQLPVVDKGIQRLKKRKCTCQTAHCSLG